MKTIFNYHKKLLTNLLSFSAIFTGLIFINSPLFAQENNEILIDYDTTAFTDQTISLDDVKISVSYHPYDYNSGDESGNLSYKIYYQNKLKINNKDFTDVVGKVYLQNFDNDQIPEVIISTYSGGAHCCTNDIIYHWQGNKFNRIELGARDGYGGSFQDLDRDGNIEYLTVDNSFLYMFSSYAGSFPPTEIFTFRNGNFENVTTQYPNLLRATLNEMYRCYLEISNSEYPDVNGILAGYVAQKILLGEYEEGWQFMLNHYDPTSDWGLEIYNNNGNVIGLYSDFPTALNAFLIRQGYLK